MLLLKIESHTRNKIYLIPTPMYAITGVGSGGPFADRACLFLHHDPMKLHKKKERYIIEQGKFS